MKKHPFKSWFLLPVVIAAGLVITALAATWQESSRTVFMGQNVQPLSESRHDSVAVSFPKDEGDGEAVSRRLLSGAAKTGGGAVSTIPTALSVGFTPNGATFTTEVKTEDSASVTASVKREGSTSLSKQEKGPSVSMAGVMMPTFQVVDASVGIPAVFGDPAVLGELTQSQDAQIAQIASDFVQNLQSSKASPSSLAYRQAWDTALFRADEAFRGMFGVPAFNAMQLSRGYHP